MSITEPTFDHFVKANGKNIFYKMMNFFASVNPNNGKPVYIDEMSGKPNEAGFKILRDILYQATTDSDSLKIYDIIRVFMNDFYKLDIEAIDSADQKALPYTKDQILGKFDTIMRPRIEQHENKNTIWILAADNLRKRLVDHALAVPSVEIAITGCNPQEFIKAVRQNPNYLMVPEDNHHVGQSGKHWTTK